VTVLSIAKVPERVSNEPPDGRQAVALRLTAITTKGIIRKMNNE